MTDREAALNSETLLAELCRQHAATRLWAQDVSLWAPAADPAVADAIRNRLGWLRLAGAIGGWLDELARFAREIATEGLTHAYLLGMGGSSLGALVLREILGVAPGGLDLSVIDTTDDFTLQDLVRRIDPARALVIVASKSGRTVEVDALEALLWAHVRRVLGAPEAARRFVALTDQGTPLDERARATGYRRVFHPPTDVGGRFSVLSLVGLVPAALMGQRLDALARAATAMSEACQRDDPRNPGLTLAAFLAAGARAGRDKLTLFFSTVLEPLGLWIEQLVAESTGKEGRGLLPIVGESWAPDRYGSDRLFVVVRTPDDEARQETALALEAVGQPVLTTTATPDTLGGEFVRWEVATAILGALLDLNPFDEPDVQAAKDRTAALLAGYEATGQLADERSFVGDDTIRATSPLAEGRTVRTPAALVRAALETLKPGDYVAWLSYLSPDPTVCNALGRLRGEVGRRARVATAVGIGPRYLHSTGQYHKGGPNRGVFFLLTADDRTETMVPERPYSFATLKRAQALGDYQALVARGRRVVHLHCPPEPEAQAAALERLFAEALR